MENSEPRKLNMEEKRKLEKLLLSDIDAAHEAFVKLHDSERRNLIEQLNQKPAPEVRALFEKYNRAREDMKAVRLDLNSLGYSVDYSDRLCASTSGTLAKPLADFDAKIAAKRQSLEALKRRYIMRLFAHNADTQSLFDSLARDLKAALGA